MLNESIQEAKLLNQMIVESGKVIREYHVRSGHKPDPETDEGRELTIISNNCALTVASYLDLMAQIRPAVLTGTSAAYTIRPYVYNIWEDIAHALRQPNKAAASTVLLASSSLVQGKQVLGFHIEEPDFLELFRGKYTLLTPEDLPWASIAYDRLSWHLIDQSALVDQGLYVSDRREIHIPLP